MIRLTEFNSISMMPIIETAEENLVAPLAIGHTTTKKF